MNEDDSTEGKNPALAWHYRRVAAGRSIEQMRLDMKESGYDIGAGTLWRISRGDDGVRVASIRKFADYAKISTDDLMRLPDQTSDEDAEFVEVSRADVAFSNGHGKLVYVEGKKSSLAFRKDYLKRIGISTKNAVIVDAEGRSNEPEIMDGAVLLVNRAPQPIINGKFYAFRCDGELLVKRLTRKPDGTIVAVSANPDKEEYPDRLIDEKSADFELIGRVYWMANEL